MRLKKAPMGSPVVKKVFFRGWGEEVELTGEREGTQTAGEREGTGTWRIVDVREYISLKPTPGLPRWTNRETAFVRGAGGKGRVKGILVEETPNGFHRRV